MLPNLNELLSLVKLYHKNSMRRKQKIHNFVTIKCKEAIQRHMCNFPRKGVNCFFGIVRFFIDYDLFLCYIVSKSGFA